MLLTRRCSRVFEDAFCRFRGDPAVFFHPRGPDRRRHLARARRSYPDRTGGLRRTSLRRFGAGRFFKAFAPTAFTARPLFRASTTPFACIAFSMRSMSLRSKASAACDSSRPLPGQHPRRAAAAARSDAEQQLKARRSKSQLTWCSRASTQRIKTRGMNTRDWRSRACSRIRSNRWRFMVRYRSLRALLRRSGCSAVPINRSSSRLVRQRRLLIGLAASESGFRIQSLSSSMELRTDNASLNRLPDLPRRCTGYGTCTKLPFLTCCGRR